MATVKVGKVSHSWFMSNKNAGKPTNKVATVEHYVSAANVTNYNAAVDDAARAATAIGGLIAAENALSKGVTQKVSVGFEYVDNAAAAPGVDEMAFAFDKIGVSFRADGENYVSSIPARVTDNDILGISGDGVNLNIDPATATEEVESYIEAFNSVVLSEEGAAPTVTGMNVRS